LAKISASYVFFISRGFFFRKIPAWANLSEKGNKELTGITEQEGKAVGSARNGCSRLTQLISA
jgi:hypothetical protein